MNEKLKQLHETLTKEGFSVPTDYSVFERTLQDPGKSKEFHQKLVESGFSVPTDYTQFSSVLGLGEKKKETPGEVSQTVSTASGEPSKPGSQNLFEKINPTAEQNKQFNEAVALNNPSAHQLMQERFKNAMQKSDEGKARKLINENMGEVDRESNPFITMGKSAWNMLAYQIPSSIAGAMATMADKHESFSTPNMYTREQEASIKRTKENLIKWGIARSGKGEEVTKDLVSSMDKVKDPIDALNWVSYALGQASAQIPTSFATAGASSIGQEVGSIYLDGVKKIAHDNNMTVEQVIANKMDHPAAAVAFGTAAGMLDYVGANKVMKVPKESLLKSLRNRALDIAKVGGTEAGTEYSQTWIEQIGKGQVAGNDLAKTWQEANTSEAARERLESAAQGLVGGAGLHQVASLQEQNINAPQGDLGQENAILNKKTLDLSKKENGKSNTKSNEFQEGSRQNKRVNSEASGNTEEEVRNRRVEASDAWLQAFERNDTNEIGNIEKELLGTSLDSKEQKELELLANSYRGGGEVRASGNNGEKTGPQTPEKGARTPQGPQQSEQSSRQSGNIKPSGTQQSSSLDKDVVEKVFKLFDLRNDNDKASHIREVREMLQKGGVEEKEAITKSIIYALQKSSSGGLFQHTQEGVGEAGSGRGRVESQQQGNEVAKTQPVQSKKEETPRPPHPPESGRGQGEDEKVKLKIDDFAERLRHGEKFAKEDKKFYEDNKEEITQLARQKNVDELPFHDNEEQLGEEFAQEVRNDVQSPQEKPAQPASEEGTPPSESKPGATEPVAEPAPDTSEEVPVNKEGKQKLVVYGTLKNAHTRGEVFKEGKVSAIPTELSNEKVEDIKGYPELERTEEGKVKADVLEVTPKELEEAKNWEKGKYNLETVELDNGEKAYVFKMKPEALAKLENKPTTKAKEEVHPEQGKEVEFEWLGSPKRGVVIGTSNTGKTKIQATNGRIYQVDKEALGSLASKGGLAISDFEKRMQPIEEGKRFKLYEHTLNLLHKYNPEGTVGQGMTGRKNRGLFYEYSRNIRLKGLNDVSVAIHELSHALDKGHGVLKKFISDTRPGHPLRKLLNKIYLEYYPNARASEETGRKTTEGYATLVQKFLEKPTEIQRKYPELVDAFLKPDGPFAFPSIKEFLADANSIIEQYQQVSPLDKIGARVADTRIDEANPKYLNNYDKVTQELFDRLAPIEKLDEEAGRNMTSTALHLWMRLSNNAMQLAEKNTTSKHHEFWQMDDKGNWSKKLDYNFNSLISDLDKRGQTVDFAHYLVARRVHEQYQELASLKADLQAHPENALETQKEIERLETIIHNDAIGEKEAAEANAVGEKMFAQEAKKYDALMAENLEFLHNPMVQLIDDDTYAKLGDVKGYAPFKRVFYDELTGDVDRPMMTSGKTKVGSLMGRHGSSKPIVNPLISSMQIHSEVLRKGMKQMVYNKVLELAESHPQLFQEVALETGPESARFPQEKNPDILMARRNYKRVPLIVNRDIKAVIDENYDFHNMHLLEHVGTTMSQLFRTGTTGIFWQFFVNNTFLDQMAATVNTRNGMMPFWSSFKEAVPAMVNLTSERLFGRAIWFEDSMEAAYLKEYLFLAGSTQTFLNADITNRSNMEKTVIGTPHSFGKRVQDYFTFMLNLLSIPGNVTEIATRFTEYSLARKAGKSQIVALEEAGRVSAPFHHQGRLGGSLGRSYVRSVPYFNSSLQVLRQMGRSLQTENGRRRYAFVALSMMAASAGTMLHLLGKDDDDEQKQILKTLAPDELSKYLFFANPYSDKRLIKVRVPEQLGWLSALTNMMLIQGAGQTDYKWSEFGEAGASFLPTQMNPFNPTQMLFSYVPPPVKTSAETVLGMKTYPNVRPIETEHDKQLPKELRFNKYTSPVAVFLGEEFGMSPKKIDHFLEGTLGRSVKYVTGKPGVWDIHNLFAKEMYFEASRQVQLYYTVKERNAQQLKAYDAELKQFSDKELDVLYQREDLVNDIEAALQDYKDIDEEVNMMEATRVRNEIFTMCRQLENLER